MTVKVGSNASFDNRRNGRRPYAEVQFKEGNKKWCEG